MRGVCWLGLLGLVGCGPSATACENGAVCPSGLKCTNDAAHPCAPLNCGNHMLDPGEVCDDGNNFSGDGCPADCSQPCGDGVIDPFEVCDPPDPGHGCSADCMSHEVCRDGHLDPAQGEQCDDGNFLDHDGCSGHCTLESPTWVTLGTAPPTRVGAAIAYDVAHGRAVLFGGCPSTDGTGCQGSLLQDTWLWDGARWARANAGIAPSPRVGAAMAYDAARGKIVLFGGCSGDVQACDGLADTWEFDGTAWAEVANPGPAGRFSHAMAYDAAHERVVMFGGCQTAKAGNCQLEDTWEWDGTSWADRTHDPLPTPRSHHAMAYDPARGKVMMFGGVIVGTQLLGDTWEWNGTRWDIVSPASAPSPRAAAAMTYDAARGKLVLFAGCTTGPVARAVPTCTGMSSEVWEWDGATWAPRSDAAPPARIGHAMTYDSVRRQLIVFGGEDAGFAALGDTWESDGTGWLDRGADPVPPAREYPALAYDVGRGKVVMFGGASFNDGVGDVFFDDTWEWDGTRWRQLTPAVAPPARSRSAMTYDAARGRVVMFGGYDGIGLLADTWEWDGTDWLQRTPATVPPERSSAALAYDPLQLSVLLFGGFNQSTIGGALDDTWEFDGIDWHQRFPSTPPPARSHHALAPDTAHLFVVLFGGLSATPNAMNDTWEWDGNDWFQRLPPTVPPARLNHAMAYNSERQKVVMFSGTDAADTWEWDGATWTKLEPATSPPARHSHGMVYDGATEQLLVFGGIDTSYRNDTWLFRFEDPSQGVEACRSGFDGDRDGAIGCVDPNCAALCKPFCAFDHNCIGQPLCGDGVCSEIEDCRLCPADCGACHTCGDFICDPGETCSTCPGDCKPCP